MSHTQSCEQQQRRIHQDVDQSSRTKEWKQARKDKSEVSVTVMHDWSVVVRGANIVDIARLSRFADLLMSVLHTCISLRTALLIVFQILLYIWRWSQDMALRLCS